MSKFKLTSTAAFAIFMTTSTWAEGDDGIQESPMAMDENGNLVMTNPQVMESGKKRGSRMQSQVWPGLG